MKPFCSWRELILIQPIKVSNSKSLLQRKTCAEEWGSTAGLVELLFLISAGVGGDFLFGFPPVSRWNAPRVHCSVHKIEIKSETRGKREKTNRRISD